MSSSVGDILFRRKKKQLISIRFLDRKKFLVNNLSFNQTGKRSCFEHPGKKDTYKKVMCVNGIGHNHTTNGNPHRLETAAVKHVPSLSPNHTTRCRSPRLFLGHGITPKLPKAPCNGSASFFEKPLDLSFSTNYYTVEL